MESDRHRTGFGIDDILRSENGLKNDTKILLGGLPSVSVDLASEQYDFKGNSLKWSKTNNYSNEELLQPQGSYCQNANSVCKSSFYAYSNPFGIYPLPQQYSELSYTHPYIPYFLPPTGLIISGYQSRRKGGQIRFTADQTKCLESKFENAKYLSPDDRRLLAMELKLSDRQVKTWFQNRRAKWRRYCNGCVSSTDNNSNQGRSPDYEEFVKNSEVAEKSDQGSKNH